MCEVLWDINIYIYVNVYVHAIFDVFSCAMSLVFRSGCATARSPVCLFRCSELCVCVCVGASWAHLCFVCNEIQLASNISSDGVLQRVLMS